MFFTGGGAEDGEGDDGDDAAGGVGDVGESGLGVLGEGDVYQDGLDAEHESGEEDEGEGAAVAGEVGELFGAAGDEEEGQGGGGAEHESEPAGCADGSAELAGEVVVGAEEEAGDEGESDGAAVRVFPMPGSPASITTRPWPSMASSIAARSPVISR